MTIYLNADATCGECGFTTRDIALLTNHSCDVQQFGGRCEDYPCCGHESGDCNGLLYGSDEAIKASVVGHVYCDHEAGVYDCEGIDNEAPCERDPSLCDRADADWVDDETAECSWCGQRWAYDWNA